MVDDGRELRGCLKVNHLFLVLGWILVVVLFTERRLEINECVCQ